MFTSNLNSRYSYVCCTCICYNLGWRFTIITSYAPFVSLTVQFDFYKRQNKSGTDCLEGRRKKARNKKIITVIYVLYVQVPIGYIRCPSVSLFPVSSSISSLTGPTVLVLLSASRQKHNLEYFSDTINGILHLY